MSNTENQLKQLLTTEVKIPQHVAIIMDGNGRWAQLRGKKRVVGHKSGVESVRSTVATAAKHGVKALTLFAFSSENWQRPESEVSVLMDLFMFVLTREVKRLHKNSIKFQVIGDLTKFSSKLQKMIKESEALTTENTGMVLSIAANYGGRWDIAQAAKVLARKVERLDLLIRTGGDYRISNFLLWQAAYAELYFTEVLWPDFNEAEFTKAITLFDQRERRFGQTSEQVTNKN